MAILKSFDPANYETKTITLSVSAGSSYTLGDAYTGGGRVVDIWGAEGFSSSVGAKNVDYVLTGIDSRLSTDYGTTYYTVFKSVTITGTVTIAYRRYGTYVDAGQINQHETRLGVHDSRFTSVESVNTTQNNRLSAIETKNGEQDADISALESGLADETEARQTHESNTTDAHGATSAATANKVMIRDANARVQIAAGADDLDAVNKQQMDAAIASAVVSAGSGDVAGPSSSVAGRIATFADTTGKILEDSGYGIGNAIGNVPINNNVENIGLKAQSARLLLNRGTSASESILDMVVADFTAYGNGAYYYTINSDDAARPWAGYAGRAYSLGDATNCKLLAYQYNTKASAVRNRVSGVWDAAWTYLTDDSGKAVKSGYAGALEDTESTSRTIKVKSKSFTGLAGSTAVTFLSAFPYGCLAAIAVPATAGQALLAGTVSASGVTFSGTSSGSSYVYIAFGY